METNKIKNSELERSLKLNIIAVTFGMVFFTIIGNPVGSAIFTGFMKELGVGDFVYSVILALPVLGAVSQIFGSYFLETTGKRKFMFLASGIVHRILWIPIALIPLFTNVKANGAMIWIITIMITISSIASSITGVSFNSWMGQLVPKDIIGRFFAVRTLVFTISSAISAIAIGFAVDRVKGMSGFSIIFAVGALFGLVDILIFIFIKHPPMRAVTVKPSLKTIITEPFKNSNYLKFVIFATAFSFGVNFAGPFFNVYMIEVLKMNYLIINLSNQVMASIATIACVRIWGGWADHYGNKPVIFISSVLIILAPISWIFATPTNYVMVFVANIFAGIGWSGYNLALFNLSVWLAPEKNRSAYTACFTLMTSTIGTALAYLCGGLFLQVARPYFEKAQIPFLMGTTLNAFCIMFIISAALRVISILFFYPSYKEKNASSAQTLIEESVKPKIKKPFRGLNSIIKKNRK
jgi:MFS family permease